MKKLIPISRNKKRAWRLFGVYIRKRGSDKNGITTCVTCGLRKHWKQMYAGHFVQGHSKATFLIEKNVHAQCVRCHHILSGNLMRYLDFMRKEYGQPTIDYLLDLKNQIWKPSRSELENIIEEYKRKCASR